MKRENLHARKIVKTTAPKKQLPVVETPPVRGSQAVHVADILGRATAKVSTTKRIPKKWAWHHRTLLSLQSRLLRERGDLRQAAAEPLEPHSLDEADSATDQFDHDFALTQLSAEQDALNEVCEALKRIQEGRYGVCEETGKAISAARLKVIPWARFTCQVEERLEKQGGGHRMRLREAATVRGAGRVWIAPEEKEEEAEETPPSP